MGSGFCFGLGLGSGCFRFGIGFGFGFGISGLGWGSGVIKKRTHYFATLTSEVVEHPRPPDAWMYGTRRQRWDVWHCFFTCSECSGYRSVGGREALRKESDG